MPSMNLPVQRSLFKDFVEVPKKLTVFGNLIYTSVNSHLQVVVFMDPAIWTIMVTTWTVLAEPHTTAAPYTVKPFVVRR